MINVKLFFGVTIHGLKLKNIYNKKEFNKKCRIFIIEGINYSIILKGR